MRFVAWVLGIIIVSVLAIVIYALAQTRVDPLVWERGPNSGLTGDFAVNDAIGRAAALLRGVGVLELA